MEHNDRKHGYAEGGEVRANLLEVGPSLLVIMATTLWDQWQQVCSTDWGRLTSKQHQILTLWYGPEHLTHAEIAERVGVQRPAVTRILQRAAKRAAEQLAQAA